MQFIVGGLQGDLWYQWESLSVEQIDDG